MPIDIIFNSPLMPYDQSIERAVPKKSEIVNTFIKLSEKIGSNKVIWRYDPIFLTDVISKEYHYKNFELLASKLHKYTRKCVISFLDLYDKTKRNLKGVNPKELAEHEMREIARNLVLIAESYGLVLETCSEVINFSDLKIGHGKCIDDKLISEIAGAPLNVDKDKTQRQVCGCVSSIDVGAYNTCHHHCLYCYANFSEKAVVKSKLLHHSKSPLLLGEIEPLDKITDREMKGLLISVPHERGKCRCT
ncbi:MAG: DUF1848 family protein [Desulfitobacteriaceae bacterium]